MLEIKEYAPRAVEVKLHGPLDRADIERLEAVLAPYAPDEGAVSAVIDVSEAWVEEGLVHSPGFLHRLMYQIDKFARIAVVSTSQVQDRIIHAVDALMPAGTLMRFEPARVSEARAFAAHMTLADARRAQAAE